MLSARALVGATALVLGGALLLHTLVYSDSWGHRERVRADLELLEAENTAAQQRTDILRDEIVAIRTREEVQEQAVRDELGYLRPGELVLELSQVAE